MRAETTILPVSTSPIPLPPPSSAPPEFSGENRYARRRELDGHGRNGRCTRTNDCLSDSQIAGNIIVASLKIPVELADGRRAYRSAANSPIFALTFATPHAVRARSSTFSSRRFPWPGPPRSNPHRAPPNAGHYPAAPISPSRFPTPRHLSNPDLCGVELQRLRSKVLVGFG